MTDDTKLTGDDLEAALKDRGLPSTGTADEKRAAITDYAARTAGNTGNTTLDSDVSLPSTTAPGDGPADTTDPTERASSVDPDKQAAAEGGHGTVNAVVPIPPDAAKSFGPVPATAGEDGSNRTETYDVRRPDGKVVTVEHNLDTGVTAVAS